MLQGCSDNLECTVEETEDFMKKEVIFSCSAFFSYPYVPTYMAT